ncbi:hypothetical protein [Pseudomonas asplenii]|uniref:hypothetical protein n=1 Tax=Pseudomonas asplenii TaxID=53407 RepID=UPI0012FD40D4|nr:hypothetical protein [Pseudomonas fuscovaginae]
MQFTVPVKQGSEVAPNVEAFRLYLDIDIQELGAERHMMSIAAACMEDMQGSFGELFSEFLRWIKQRLDDLGEGSAKSATASLELGFTAIICPEVNADYNTKEQLKDYKVLLQRSNLQELPLLRQYIEHRSAEVASTSSSHLRPPYGLFEREYPLGRGQMMALAQVSSGASLLAVQGAPGTGKTTLFKSLIASQIVERALACIGGNDRNLGLVVTSTAKKAVENVIDDLRGDAYLENLNWLYFQGGDSGQVTNELQRVSGLLRQLDAELHDLDKQKALAARIIETRRLIDVSLRRFEELNKHLEEATALLKGVSPEDFEAQIRLLGSDVSRQCLELGFSVERGADIAQQCADALASLYARRGEYAHAKKWLSGGYGKLVGAPFSLENYRAWLSSSLSENLQHHFAEHPVGGLRLLLAKWFGGKYRAAKEHLYKAYSEEFSTYGLAGLDHLQLAKLACNRKELFAVTDVDQLLKAAGWQESDADRQRERALKLLSTDFEELKSRVSDLHRYNMAKHALQDEFPEGDWFEVLRMRFIAQQRVLFECAIDYLWQELLRQKASLRQVLSLWSSMLSGKQDSGYYRWKDKLEEFYRLITLAYPVMASTLASAHKLAGYISSLNSSACRLMGIFCSWSALCSPPSRPNL